MVGILGAINSQGQNSLGLNLSGFFNGKAIGNNSNEGQSNGILGGGGQSLAQRLGLGLSSANGQANLLTNSLQNLNKSLDKTAETEKQRETDEKKKDRLETSDGEGSTTGSALQSALRNGDTQQIVVSEDGRFEASIDMRLNADGSYSLDMSVHFANSQAAAAAMSSMQQVEDQTGTEEQEANLEEDPASLAYKGASASYERYTSYEQILQTRGFEASIFFEEAKSVAAQAEQAYGSEMGAEYTSVAGAVAHEYTLNISISGDDLSNFNQVAEDLMQFDDSGTLGGFLTAAQNVLTADSSDLGAFVDATQSLVGATQEHVGAKLTNFFSSMQEQFGGTLEEMGFEPNFIENLGADVQNDLNTFFQITNNMFANMFGSNNDQVEESEDPDAQQLEALDEQLEQMKEKRRELIGDPLPPRPERHPLYQNELPPEPEQALDAVA